MEDGKTALRDHVIEKGLEIYQKYGPIIGPSELEKILRDSKCVKFPTRIEFTVEMDPGLFARTAEDPNNTERSYIVYVHEFFKDKPGYIPMLVLYHLVTINYGDFANHEDAEFFGASALGIEVEEYYQKLCELTDMITV